MENSYKASSDKLHELLQTTKTQSMVHINMAIVFGILVQTILSIADIAIDRAKLNDIGAYLYYNSNVVTCLIMAPFFIYFIVLHFIKSKRKENISSKAIDVNINLVIIFVLTFFFQLSVLSDGAFYNFMQGAGLISIATYISGMTRSRKHTIITLLIGCGISIFSLYYHGWQDKYLILIDPKLDKAVYEYVQSPNYAQRSYATGSSVTTPSFYLQVVLTESLILFLFIMISTKAIQSVRVKIPAIIDDMDLNKTEITRLQTIENTTKEIQKFAMSNKSSFIINNIYIDAVLIPSGKCGGDFYDTYSNVHGETIFWIGDVAGHGLMSSIIMSLIQASINTYIRAMDWDSNNNFMDLKVMYDTLNTIYYDEMVRKFDYTYPTSLVICKIKHGKLSFIGQHEKFLIKTKKYNSLENTVLVKNTMELGVPFGIQRDLSAYTHVDSLVVHEGDDLLFFTDGITESKNSDGELYGVDRLVEAFELSKSINSIIGDLDAWSSEAEEDDKTLLHLKIFL